MVEECLICKAPLEYLKKDIIMECEICHKKENSKTRCINGHYICNQCHMDGIDVIIELCHNEKSTNPIKIIKKMMSLPFCHMHGPEHHIMVGTALVTAYKNAGGDIDLFPSLLEVFNRAKQIPGGSCGFWGACGAGIGSGIYISVISEANPLSSKAFGLSNQMTAKALNIIGTVGGPRCCKRNSFLAILEAVQFTKIHFNISMELSKVKCSYSNQNSQCIKDRCPFYYK